MADGYIPKGLWLCTFNLRKWIKAHNSGKVPPEVEEWLDHLDGLGRAANDFVDARDTYEQASKALSRFGKDVATANLRKIDRARAQVEVESNKLRRYLKSKGPAQ